MKTDRSVCGHFILGAVAILGLVGCGESGPPPGTPEALYLDLGCAKCHGPDRQGQKSGPPLIAIGDHWQEEKLLEYLADPKGFMEKNPRLKYMAENYPIMMPAFPDTNEEDLRKLARFILSS